jgi:hypothetical protein
MKISECKKIYCFKNLGNFKADADFDTIDFNIPAFEY